ncbi:hypothetical protein H5410_000129 [Solanum commersonii]|uniref:DUF4283 domain-containing protein n=1 Tax=Solanum commersonii TaxID=4109 RepID=A0A9J6AVE2_SOLCO|nr:hypothetical protein H5410_000129 [Solanum commersonii]
MAAVTTGGTFPPEEFPPLHGHDTIKPQKIGNGNQNIMQYAQILQPKPMNPQIPKVTPKPVVMLQGEPNITWKASEVRSLDNYGIKSECTIGVLDSRHILIRLNSLEDYVQVLSTTAYYVKARNNYWQMRTLKWDPWFEPDEAIFSIAAAVGKPLTVDMATRNQTRPSCARVKIEVDLTAKLPQRVRITEEDDITGDTKYKWVKVQYDYMPKYCKECHLQGHNEHSCWSIHLELYEKRNEAEEGNKGEEEVNTITNPDRQEPNRILSSGRVVGQRHYK